MGKLSSYKRIITSDFPKEYKNLVEPIGSIINDSFNELYFAINGRLDIRNNIYCTYKELDVTVDANGRPLNTTTFTLTNQAPVLGISLIYAVNQSNSAIYPSGAPFISFSQIDGGILINNITGLQANQRYTIRVIAWN